MENKKQAGIRSISRAVEILMCLSDGATTVNEIANYTKLSMSTTHRLLKALVEARLVTQDTIKHKYYLGISLLNKVYSNPQTIHRHLITLAQETMLHLSRVCNETILLSLFHGMETEMLWDIPSNYGLRITEDGTGPEGIFTTTTQKVLLSQLEDIELQQVIERMNSGTLGLNKPIDKEAFMSEVMKIREVKYAMSNDERISGVLSISVPVSNYSNPVSLTIIGSEKRMEPKKELIIRELLNGAQYIANSIAKNESIMRTYRYQPYNIANNM